MDFYSALVSLFMVMDPLGNVPFFLSVLKGVAPERRQKVLARELIIAYIALVLFLLGGRYVIGALGLQQESIRVAGGIILFLIALRMVFPEQKHMDTGFEGEPLVVPLAIPGVAGPSALAMVLLLQQSYPERQMDWLLALTGAWLISAAVLMASPFFYRVLRERGLMAMERLMGMILVALSVQMFLEGTRSFLAARGR